MSPLQIQWDRIRRRWALILVIGIVAAAGSLGASLLQGSTYTGRSALTIVSQDRAPEQDTVLAQGYADYFNQASSQQQLRQTAGIDSSVGLNARIAAASPIVYIEAVADSPEVASDAATKMAVALRDDVNSSLGGDSQAAAARRPQPAARRGPAAGDQAQVSTLQRADQRPPGPEHQPAAGPAAQRRCRRQPDERRAATPPPPWSAVCSSAPCWPWRWAASRTAS